MRWSRESDDSRESPPFSIGYPESATRWRVTGQRSGVGDAVERSRSLTSVFPCPTVRIREPCPGAAGDPQLWSRGVGRHQVSEQPCSQSRAGAVPALAFLMLQAGSWCASSGLRSHALEPGPGEEGRPWRDPLGSLRPPHPA